MTCVQALSTSKRKADGLPDQVERDMLLMLAKCKSQVAVSHRCCPFMILLSIAVMLLQTQRMLTPGALHTFPVN